MFEVQINDQKVTNPIMNFFWGIFTLVLISLIFLLIGAILFFPLILPIIIVILASIGLTDVITHFL